MEGGGPDGLVGRGVGLARLVGRSAERWVSEGLVCLSMILSKRVL